LCSQGRGEAHPTQHSTEHVEPPTSTSSSTLDEGVLDQRSAELWGNMVEKHTTTLWVVFQNIGGFLKDKDMDVKLETLQCFITEKEIDIFGFTEVNKSGDL